MITTCGVFVINNDGRVLIVHPTLHHKDIWSIPKGQKEQGESEEETAVREVDEETGLIFNKNYLITIPGYINYKNKKKRLKSYYIVSDKDISNIDIICRSSFYHKGVKQRIPENDKHAWATYKQARKRIHHTQIVVLDKLYVLGIIK